jgi:DNA-binding XRE family transcriptional regulator
VFAISLIDQIEKILESKSIRKTEFAAKIGLSRDTVYNFTDENIKVSVLVKICIFYTSASAMKMAHTLFLCTFTISWIVLTESNLTVMA